MRSYVPFRFCQQTRGESEIRANRVGLPPVSKSAAANLLSRQLGASEPAPGRNGDASFDPRASPCRDPATMDDRPSREPLVARALQHLSPRLPPARSPCRAAGRAHDQIPPIDPQSATNHDDLVGCPQLPRPSSQQY
ncbi:unnamed protein product [Diplocarpon coronariae]